MKEKDWQRSIVQLAHTYQWSVAHFPTANPEGRFRTVVAADAAGWPDLTLLRERLIFFECKAPKGYLRPSQASWIDGLLKAGCEAYIIRPVDLGAAQRVLEIRKPLLIHPDKLEGTHPGRDLYWSTRREVDKALAKQAA